MSTKRPTSEYRFLRCVLTKEEQREYSQRMAHAYQRKIELGKISYNFDERIMSSVREDTFEIVHEEVIPEALMQTNLVDDGSDGKGENVLEVGETKDERTAEEIAEGIIGHALKSEKKMA